MWWGEFLINLTFNFSLFRDLFVCLEFFVHLRGLLIILKFKGWNGLVPLSDNFYFIRFLLSAGSCFLTRLSILLLFFDHMNFLNNRSWNSQGFWMFGLLLCLILTNLVNLKVSYSLGLGVLGCVKKLWNRLLFHQLSIVLSRSNY